MGYENVKLWFAKNTDQDIITIDEINDDNKYNTYSCPVCGSTLKPKATKSKQVTSHFAHVDASKCNSESQIHFWFKHKFLEKGDKFTVAADDVRDYVCKDILVEKSYEVGDKLYKPDVTILTECGNIIYFEMAFSNKKEIKDYLDIWLELKNIVVEVDVKQLTLMNKIPTYKALFYEGKCFHTKKNDTYYNTIGKYKEEKLCGNVDNELKGRILKLDWFWNDIFKYKKGEVDIKHMVTLIDSIDIQDKEIAISVIKKSMCNGLYKDYKEYKKLNEEYQLVYPYDDGNHIKTLIEQLNDEYNLIDDSVKISYEREKIFITKNYVKSSRKFKLGSYTVFSHFKLLVKINYLGEEVFQTVISNKIFSSKNKDELHTFLSEYIDFYNKRIIKNCNDCKNEYLITFGEVKFYNDKGLHIPKRCNKCREERKIKEN